MCGVFAQTGLDFRGLSDTIRHAKKALKEKRIKEGQSILPNFNIWTGMNALVVTQEEPDFMQNMQFGFTPDWAKKQMYLFNARVEGDENQLNSPYYSGEMGIFEKPAFKEAIRHNRCIVPMDYFIEGPEKLGLKKPFLFKRKDDLAFVVAGIWNKWQLKDFSIYCFSILTTPASKLVKQIGHHRSPLILNYEDIDGWLDKDNSPEKLTKLMQPFDSEEFECYPISDGVTKKQNTKEVMTPILELF